MRQTRFPTANPQTLAPFILPALFCWGLLRRPCQKIVHAQAQIPPNNVPLIEVRLHPILSRVSKFEQTVEQIKHIGRRPQGAGIFDSVRHLRTPCDLKTRKRCLNPYGNSASEEQVSGSPDFRSSMTIPTQGLHSLLLPAILKLCCWIRPPLNWVRALTSSPGLRIRVSLNFQVCWCRRLPVQTALQSNFKTREGEQQSSGSRLRDNPA
jgi:hypothetical protein